MLGFTTYFKIIEIGGEIAFRQVRQKLFLWWKKLGPEWVNVIRVIY